MRFPPGQGLITAGGATVWGAEQTFDGGALIPSGATLSASGTGVVEATQLSGQPATNYLRTDANAPDPQTVTNPVKIPVQRNGNSRPNLLFNSTFALGLIGWQQASGLAACQFNGVANSNYTVYAGTTAVFLDSTGIPGTAGEEYTISGWVFNGASGGANGLVLVAYNGTTAISNFALVTIPADTGWTYVSATGTAPANTTVIYAQLYIPNPATANSNIAFTRIKVENGNFATPYSMEADMNITQYPNEVPFLRMDSGAPNPQTVANSLVYDSPGRFNESLFIGSTGGISNAASGGGYIGWNYVVGTCETDFMNNKGGGPGGFHWYNNNGASDAWNLILQCDDNGNFTTAGSVTSSAGQLGSASGTWTPASGTFNVAIGTAINVATVPSGAKAYTVGTTAGTHSGLVAFGASGSNGSWWGGGSSSPGYSEGVSGGVIGETFGGTILYDGSYYTTGYFQINAGYLQFVTMTAATANADGATTFSWAVS